MTTEHTTTTASDSIAPWPTADEIAAPIIGALRRLNDLAWDADTIAATLAGGHHDPDTIASARRYVNLVNDIARRCRVVADSCTLHSNGENGLRLDAALRSIARDGIVAAELFYVENPQG